MAAGGAGDESIKNSEARGSSRADRGYRAAREGGGAGDNGRNVGRASRSGCIEDSRYVLLPPERTGKMPGTRGAETEVRGEEEGQRAHVIRAIVLFRPRPSQCFIAAECSRNP
jgi:hypothetical protein